MAEGVAWHKSRWIGLGAFVLAAAVQIGSATWPEKIRPHIYLFFSLFAFVVLCISVPILTSILGSIKALTALKNAEGSALQIIFEPLNPARRFWSLEQHKDALGRICPPYWEHRVEVRNNSIKTLRNVMVTVERTGQLPQLPVSPVFRRTEAERCDLNPGCSELIRVNTWPQPKAQEGMLCGESAWAYGPIKVTASADDTPSVVKVFAFNYETNQMLFDMEVY